MYFLKWMPVSYIIMSMKYMYEICVVSRHYVLHSSLFAAYEVRANSLKNLHTKMMLTKLKGRDLTFCDFCEKYRFEMHEEYNNSQRGL